MINNNYFLNVNFIFILRGWRKWTRIRISPQISDFIKSGKENRKD